MSCNVLEEYIGFSKTCLKNYVKRILDKGFDQEIFARFLKVYVDSRYYNANENPDKSFEYNVGIALRNEVEVLRNDAKLKEVSENTFKAFKYLLYFDNVKESNSIKSVINDLNNFRIEELGITNDKNFSKEIFEMVKEDLFQKKDFISKFDSKNFHVDFHLTNIKNVYNASLESKLKFPALYDQNAIKKIFDSKEIFEERLVVEYSYVAKQILLDVIKGDFKKNYLISYDVDLNDKKNNQKKLLNVVDNDIAKEKVAIKITFSDFMKDRESIYVKMRLGFKFAVILDESFVYNENNLKFLTIFKYIIISAQSVYYKELSHRNNIVILR